MSGGNDDNKEAGRMRRRLAALRRQRSDKAEPTEPTEPTVPEPRVVPVEGEMIRLGQFLKLAGLVDSGAEAKDVIAEGLVSVDGETETRRGRQLRAGAVVSLRGETVRVGEPGEDFDVPW